MHSDSCCNGSDILHSTSIAAIAYSNALHGQGSGSILLDDVACTGTESRLIDCSYDSSTADCSHSEDAAVYCSICEFSPICYLWSYLSKSNLLVCHTLLSRFVPTLFTVTSCCILLVVLEAGGNTIAIKIIDCWSVTNYYPFSLHAWRQQAC